MTRETKHTPGPWRTGEGEFQDQVFAEILIPPTRDDWGKALICETGGNEANARLIAAAPEMLEALRELFKHCVMIHKHWGEGCNSKEASEAEAKCRAILAKIEGRDGGAA